MCLGLPMKSDSENPPITTAVKNKTAMSFRPAASGVSTSDARLSVVVNRLLEVVDVIRQFTMVPQCHTPGVIVMMMTMRGRTLGHEQRSSL